MTKTQFLKAMLLFLFAYSSSFSFAQSPPENSFFVIHCDPDFADNLHYQRLQEMVDSADAYGVPLTIQMSPTWVDLVLADSAKFDTIRAWQTRGHEIAAHHHGIHHCYWDEYTNYPSDSIAHHQPTGGACDSGTFIANMVGVWDNLDSIAGDSMMMTWGSSDSFPAVDMHPNIKYRTDGGRDTAIQGFSNIYTATWGPTTIDATTYGPYTVCSIDYFFIENMGTVTDMIALYNDSVGYSGQFNTVGVVTHTFDYHEAIIQGGPNYFIVWLNFISGNGCQTVREILRESPVCASVNSAAKLRTADFKLWPNPAATKLHLELPAANASSLQVIDLQGATVIESKFVTELDISGLRNGLYYVIIQSDQGILVKSFRKDSM